MNENELIKLQGGLRPLHCSLITLYFIVINHARSQKLGLNLVYLNDLIIKLPARKDSLKRVAQHGEIPNNLKIKYTLN